MSQKSIKIRSCRTEVGFTLIELLIVIAIIGILTGVVLVVINPIGAQNRAHDGVRRSNVAKLAQAAEAYNAAEGSYPTDDAAFSGSGFVRIWPSDATYTYTLSGATACVYVSMASTVGSFIKWCSSDGKTMKNCSSNGCCVRTSCVD